MVQPVLCYADRLALRGLSSRARITAASFTNSYAWGDFKGDPARLMETSFDLHLYPANWGSRRLMICARHVAAEAGVQRDAALAHTSCGCLALRVNDEWTLGTTIPLPAPPSGWFDYDYAVLWNGSLALVRTDIDIHGELRHWRDQGRGGNPDAPKRGLCDARLRLSMFDGSDEIGAVEVPGGEWPLVDCLADGRWLVVSTRADPDENNARVFAVDGTPAGAFAVSDGISHLRCAADGTIWVGYFDEGVFAPAGKDGIWPVSSSGLARFGPDGSVLWRFNVEERDDLFIADCYALALDENTLWCCPYTSGDTIFPIVRVKDGVVDHWRNDVAGAWALAADGDHILLAGGYSDDRDRLALLRLGGDQAELISERRFQPLVRNAARLVQGQGGTLHIVGPGRWTRLSLATLRQTLKT